MSSEPGGLKMAEARFALADAFIENNGKAVITPMDPDMVRGLDRAIKREMYGETEGANICVTETGRTIAIHPIVYKQDDDGVQATTPAADI